MTNPKSNELYLKELANLNKPYTDEELADQLASCEFKSALEHYFYRCFHIIKAVMEWDYFLYRHGKKPKFDLVRIFRREASKIKSSDTSENHILKICHSLKEYGYNDLPPFRVVTFCSSAAASLYEKLSALLSSPNLTNIHEAESRLFLLLSNQGADFDSAADYEESIDNLYTEYSKSLIEYSYEIERLITTFRKNENLRKQGLIDTLPPTIKDFKTIVQKSAKTTVKKIRAAQTSDYEHGPKGSARKRQITQVVEQLKRYASNPSLLPENLRNKEPVKWISLACCTAFIFDKNGYPTDRALYYYCHTNSELVLTLAGL